MKILDCTLRDGGYYNNWDFKTELVNEYLDAMGKSKVDYVELGFRFYNKKSFYGPYAYTTDEYIASLEVPKGLKLGVMLNFADILSSGKTVKETMDELFSPKKESPITLVRFACHFEKATMAKESVEYLKSLGYVVGLNIMQVNACSKEELTSISAEIQSWGSVDALYFADSMGNMHEKDIKDTIAVMRTHWKGDMGIHAHNNMGQAEQNTLTAMDNGVEWLDGTILGMGRGAGNLKIENFLINIKSKNQDLKYLPECMFGLVTDGFKKLKDRYEWGENIFYYLSAIYNIHPTYVQEMQSSEGYSTEDKVGVLKHIEKIGGRSFSKKTLSSAVISNTTSSNGGWDSSNWTKGKDVVLVAGGSSLKDYRKDIENFIDKKDAIVISLNYNKNISQDKIDIYASCYLTKIISQMEDLLRVEKPLMIPIGAMPEELAKEFSKKDIMDYGMFVEDGVFEAKKEDCVIPYPLVFAYVISSIANTNTENIYMVGFDGYPYGDYRNNDMENVLELFNKRVQGKKIISLTPTMYNVEKNSIFNPFV